MICDRCRKAAPISNMRLLPKGKDNHTALCLSCRSHNDIFETKSARAPTQAEKYRCLRCNYIFKFKDSQNTRFRCPYCGKDDCLAEDKKITADKIIKLSY